MKENYQKVINLIEALNEIEKGIGKNPFFEWQIVSNEFRVYGHPAELAQLYALLWSNTYDYSIYMHRDEDGNYIEFFYVGGFR